MNCTNNVKIRKLGNNVSSNASNKSSLKKTDFTNISIKLEEKLNHLLNSKAEHRIKVLDLELVINEAIIEAAAPIEVNKRLLDKLEENRNSTIALMSYIYGFILRSKNQGVIEYGSSTKKLDLINRNN